MRFAIFFLTILITAQSAKAAEFVMECQVTPGLDPHIYKYEEGFFSDEIYIFHRGEWKEYCGKKWNGKPTKTKRIKTVEDKRMECKLFDEENKHSSTQIIDFSAKVYRSTYVYQLDNWKKDRKCKSR